MKIDKDNLNRCAEIAEEMRDHYDCTAQTNDSKKSLSQLKDFISDFVGKPVEIHDLELRADRESTFRGVMLPKGGSHYEIYILKEADESTRRFVICKELFQVALDAEEVRNINILEHVEALLFQEMREPTPAVIAEQMAEISAMDFLYPYSQRISDKKRIEAGELSYKSVSEYYGIPQIYIEQYLSAGFMEDLKETHLLKKVV